MSGALRQLMRRQRDARALVSLIAESMGSPVAVEDADGQLLHGEAPSGASTRFPITQAGTRVGWVAGGADARLVAALLDHLVAGDAEKKALGAEVLHLYREVNLIYSFSEKLAALLDLDAVAATDAARSAADDRRDRWRPDAARRSDAEHSRPSRDSATNCRTSADSGSASVSSAPLPRPAWRKSSTTWMPIGGGSPEHPAVKALICCPLKVGERVIGVIAIGSTMPMAYTAAELKLLTTLALQGATAIENARLFERTVQAAHERERLMALHQAAEVARAKLESELTLAARIQADLFPAELPRDTWIRAGGQESPGTAVWRRLLRRAHAARAVTTGSPCVSRMSRARACRRPWS